MPHIFGTHTSTTEKCLSVTINEIRDYVGHFPIGFIRFTHKSLSSLFSGVPFLWPSWPRPPGLARLMSLFSWTWNWTVAMQMETINFPVWLNAMGSQVISKEWGFTNALYDRLVNKSTPCLKQHSNPVLGHSRTNVLTVMLPRFPHAINSSTLTLCVAPCLARSVQPVTKGLHDNSSICRHTQTPTRSSQLHHLLPT